jgi:hypothetical protein
MTFVPVNLTNVDTDGPQFETLAEGSYLCRIDKAELRDSRNTPGNKVLHVEYVVNNDTEHPNANGRRIFDDLSLSQNALWRVKQLTEAAQLFPGPEGFDSVALIGLWLRVGVTLEARMEKDPVTQAYNKPVMKDGVQQYRNRVGGYARV